MRRPDGKSVMFQPFITSLSENFNPSWNQQNYFGRVDPVATYQGTSRSISMSFKMVCFDRGELEVIFRKLNWLTSMVYPEYENDAYGRGPVVRMRVGNLMSADGTGLPGYLTNLGLSYDESIWEMDDLAKLPRNINVTLGFQVLHDKSIGLVKDSSGRFVFGGLNNYQIGGYGSSTTETFIDADIKMFRDAFGKNYMIGDSAVQENSSAQLTEEQAAFTKSILYQIDQMTSKENVDGDPGSYQPDTWTQPNVG